ncbi:MAG: IS30 family transposase [Bacteroidota bacterium]
MKHLTREQRYIISVMKGKLKQSEIAEAIDKDKSIVSRELKRNCDKRNGFYNADLAQRKYERRQREKPKHRRFTTEVEDYVKEQLSKDFSPEQIAGRAKVDGVTCVSHESIYQYIWGDKRKKGDLHTHLRHKGRKYQKRGNKTDKRGCIKNRVSIEQRPAIVDEKKRFGDFEADTIIGKNHQGAILTINDRSSSLVIIRKLEGKEADGLAENLIEALTPISEYVLTITNDNGKEFAQHERISKELNTNVYFAHPYHSWERGANENMNGLIRQYLPKGISFENVTNKHIYDIQNKLNNRPRKKLNFLTPNEYILNNFAIEKVAFMT